jgi:transcriptional regulator of arginine metabolism
MMRHEAVRQERKKAIRELLEREVVHGQEEIVERLRARGIEVGQACISRDLRELGVAKVGGVYRLSGAVAPPPPATALDLVGRLVVGVSPAGPHLLVVKTAVGGAAPVGIAVDKAAWPEVVGTLAGDDTLFIATRGLREQQRVRERLSTLVGIGSSKERPS